MPIESQAAHSEKWYERALMYVGFTVVVIAILIALIAIGGEAGVSVHQRLWQIVGLLIACGCVAGAYLTLFRATTDGITSDGVVPATIVFDAVCFTVGGLVIASFANATDPKRWAATIMWSLACLAIGAIAGFLFGIPRSRRESQPARAKPVVPVVQVSIPPVNPGGNIATARPPATTDPPIEAKVDTVPPEHSETSSAAVAEPAPSAALPGAAVSSSTGSVVSQNVAPAVEDTAPAVDRFEGGDPSPIEQISDWLTKILVGIGLANLKELPGQMDNWAKYVAMSVGGFSTPAAGTALDGSGASLALGIILYFLILGFMACYILTQIFLRNLINKASTA